MIGFLEDALNAAEAILCFVDGVDFKIYEENLEKRSAVERQFEILGEALKRVRDTDEAYFDSISGARGAISFRNILAHAYDSVEGMLVWGIIEDDLPTIVVDLKSKIEELN